ncbi:betaine-aldehyde dehydrogenase [Eremomyces bilateralis CBS 781.70]|uniref:aldehyde dehydrogenase (NAD(+)) n=1 Tax=Eremomyces bilateralis CBS 781.70 TaxID=1392243 RepID=A0A6G1G9P3_9PEZI|nr:betaine-aldehyde dehydrogenase [Eremomyces bilateralis CBS 781.70]KAF1814798.1 betaine-aldehyde dehydrogenase [Eremomyces bilateralis CBS 781.70]
MPESLAHPSTWTSDKPALLSHDRYAIYNGSLQTPLETDTSSEFRSVDPATGIEHPCRIFTSSPKDVAAAVSSAEAAFPEWKSTTPSHRAAILMRAAALLRELNDVLAEVETRDTGRAFSETSAVDVPSGVEVMEYCASFVAGGGLDGRTVKLREDAWVYETKDPIGVCAGIGAWNYPLQIAIWKSAPCLAAGNAMVYKPSEVTSLHAALLASIYSAAGVPSGVFNVVYGAGAVGAQLTSHPGIGKVSFTGQVATGRKVAKAAGEGMKYVTAELGGKSPLIICDDVDIETAVDGAMMANFYSTGQVCTNGTRVYVHRSIAKRFEEILLQKMEHIRFGDVMDEKSNMGPLVSKEHFEKVIGYIKHGIEVDKAKLLYGGLETPQIDDKFKGGYWVKPTVFTNCTDSMKIVREEIFGPVMSILLYDTTDEAIRRANDTELGLAGGVFTKDVNRAHKIAGQLEAGIIWINTWGESPAEMAVGGWKMSGVGVENGRKGIEAWTRGKSTLVDMSGQVPTAFSKL